MFQFTNSIPNNPGFPISKEQWSCCSSHWSQLPPPLARCSGRIRTVCRSAPGSRLRHVESGQNLWESMGIYGNLWWLECHGVLEWELSQDSHEIQSHMFFPKCTLDDIGRSLKWYLLFTLRLPSEFHGDHVAKLLKHLFHPGLIHILRHPRRFEKLPGPMCQAQRHKREIILDVLV